MMDEQAQDTQSIEQVVVDAEQFQSDPEKFSQLLTSDVVLVNVAGIRLVGRDEVYRRMKSAMTTSLADIITKYEVGHITFLRSDVALMSGTKRIFAKSGDALTETGKACLTIVLVKNQDGWLIASIQNTPIL
jgi:uncharacterized protein (TIGR02246 family)